MRWAARPTAPALNDTWSQRGAMFLDPILRFFQAILTLGNTLNWDYVWTYLFSIYFFQGAILTVILAVFGQSIGSLIGLLLYFMRRSNVFILRRFVGLYVWFFRGTPLLVQILFLYTLLPHIGLARPLIAVHLFKGFGFQLETPFDAFVVALIALALNEGAYMSEIVRAGIDSIETGQLEAARSLGMTYGLAMRRIVLPQALRIIVPPLGNEFNSMLKTTSLAYSIGVFELYANSYDLGNSFGRPLELAIVGALWYLALTTLWGLVQAQIERRLNASTIDPALRDQGPWWQRVVGFGRRGNNGIPGEIAVPALSDRR
jgi:polar amino acid transport system permease protein